MWLESEQFPLNIWLTPASLTGVALGIAPFLSMHLFEENKTNRFKPNLNIKLPRLNA